MSKYNPSNTIAQPPRLHRTERHAENFVRGGLRRSGGASLDSKTFVSTEIRQSADMRDYLAAERTFLAWIRTGLALMGFGFVVARFGLFLRQLQFFRQPGSASSTGLSLWVGNALIAAGGPLHII